MPAQPDLTTDDPHRTVRYWLYAVALLVIVMILVGGATRLTDSGLSITEWAPISGVVPPLSLAAWEAAFAAYQQTTEFKTINASMTLEEFKFIFWWEWGHRFLGRLIGLVAIVPLVWFWIRNRLPPQMKMPLVGLVLLGGLQGAIGWWMVKSGLTHRVDVSQIRLAVHLTMACIILVWTLWLARSLIPHTAKAPAGKIGQAGLLVLLVLVQIFLGGLVAGLDAGMAYNTWPTMNGEWAPEGLFAMQPVWLNFTDNAMMVQFVHRLAAYGLWLFAAFHCWQVVRSFPSTAHAIRAVTLFGLVTLQACIGIITLLMQVPLFWALLHQAGAVIVLCAATIHWRALAGVQSSAIPSADADGFNYAHGNG